MPQVTYGDALAVGKQTPRVYIPRIHHVAWTEQIHVLIGVASHLAWEDLAKKYKLVRLKGYDKFKEHKALIGAFMRGWAWDIVSAAIPASK